MSIQFNKRWQLRGTTPPAESTELLARELGITPLTARTLWLRGIKASEAGREFLDARLTTLPDPDLLPDLAPACARIEQALRRGEKLTVHGDYDVDGISGASLLVDILRKLGGEVEYHIPLRMKDGYGLSADALRQAAASGCRLVISVDCGVSAHAEADLAAELGLDLIITDHHQPPSELPQCLALINPHLPGSEFPWPELSGVGVAFFMLAGLRRRLRESGYFTEHPEPDLRLVLDLVALGTIADLVPLAGVNRILVRAGLDLLDQQVRPGIVALKQVAKVKQASCGTVGFQLAPRLNAAGRLEDAAFGVRLLLTNDRDEAAELAGLLDGFNRERQQLEQRTLEQAIALIEQQGLAGGYSLVLGREGWHPGVIGIVASRLVERYQRPTVLISLENGRGKGSARSIRGFHLFQALQETAGLLDSFGGHAMAAGLSLAEAQLDSFAAALEKVARSRLSDDDLLPLVQHDGEAELQQLTTPQVEELACLAPFGIGNPQPCFVLRGCRVKGMRILAEKHLKFTAEQNGQRVEAIGFGLAEAAAQLSEEVDLLARPTLNHWRGATQVQLQIVDFRPVEER